MQNLWGRRPSAAMVVAVAALCMSLVGTGVAATISVFGSHDKKVVRKIARKQADMRISARAGDLHVATADQLQRLTVQKQDFQVADNTANGALAQCPSGQQVISGGVITGANDAFVTNSVPANAVVGDLNDGQTFSAWRGFVVNQLGQSGTIMSTVYAVCAG